MDYILIKDTPKAYTRTGVDNTAKLKVLITGDYPIVCSDIAGKFIRGQSFELPIVATTTNFTAIGGNSSFRTFRVADGCCDECDINGAVASGGSSELSLNNLEMLHFNNGRAITGKFTLTLPFTAMMRVKFDKDSASSGILGLFGAGKNNASSEATPFSLGFSFATKIFQIVCNGSVESINRLIGYEVPFGWDNNVHSLVWVVRSVNETGFDCDLYIDGSLQTKNQRYVDNQAYLAFDSPNDSIVVLNKDSLLYSHVSNPYPCDYNDIYLLNFDASAEDAPYTIADYQQGKPIPPLLLKGTQKVLDNNYTDWDIYNKSSFEISQDSNADTITATCISPVNYCTFTDGWKSGLKAGDVVSVSWENIEVSSGVSVIGTRTNSATNGSVEIANGGTFVQQADSSYVYFQVNLSSNVAVGDTITVKGLRIRVNGALLALENYTLNGKVLDYSGNNNHASISGVVKGDNDTRIQAFINAITTTTSEQN